MCNEDRDICALTVFLWISSVITHLSDCWDDIYSNNSIIRHSTDTIVYTTRYIYNGILQKRIEPKEERWWSVNIILDGVLEEMFIYENSPGIMNAFMIYHTPNYVLCSNTQITYDDPPILSTIRFLSVEYTHPDMEHTLQLTLEPKWCMIGNEVLGNIHVLRMLEYQFIKTGYIYDERYVLNIIDSNIRMFQMNGRQYLKIGEEGYDIVG